MAKPSLINRITRQTARCTHFWRQQQASGKDAQPQRWSSSPTPAVTARLKAGRPKQ